MRGYVADAGAKSLHLMVALLLATAMVTAAVTVTATTTARASTVPSAPAYATAGPAVSRANAASPEAKVSKKGAVSWALKNWKGSYNGFGDDCTDFVSRALAYGGARGESASGQDRARTAPPAGWRS